MGRDLSERERRLLQLAADGLCFRESGKELGITENYAKRLGMRIRDKLGADNMTQAVAMALRRKLIE